MFSYMGRMTFRSFLMLLVTLSAAGLSRAQPPTIDSTSISGELRQGVSVTIVGSGFGAGGSYNLHHLWDSVENQESYSGYSDGKEVPVGLSYPWEDQTPSDPVVFDYSGQQRHPYSKAQYRSDGGDRHLGNPTGAGGSSALPETNEVFVSYWIKFDRDPFEVVNNAAHKLVRVWGGGTNDLRISWNTRGNVGLFNSNAGGTSSINGYSLVDGETIWDANKWHLHEMWVSSKEGIIESYVDGVLINRIESDDPRYLKREHEHGPRVALIGFNPSHGEGVIYDTKYLMDDIAVLPTRARVLLSDQSNWSKSDSYEFQPATTWSSSSIDIRLNYGAIPEGANLYLYIVTPSGEVNEEGFALSKCLECPSQVPLKILE